VRRSWILITLLAAGACGSSPPPAPSPGPGGGSGGSITGRERIGWDQPADSPSELATFQYAIYVDGTRSLVTETSCSGAAGTSGYPCSGRLPAMSNGAHTLALATFITADGEILEGARSASINVTVSALTAPAADWPDTQTETLAEGVQLRIDRIAEGFNRPTDAAFLPDGRLLIAERSGRVRIVDGGRLQDRDALALAADEEAVTSSSVSLAVDPEFARTGFVLVAHAAPAHDGAMLRVSRYRELGGRLAERAVLFETPLPDAEASSVIRFGPDGKLYVAASGAGTDGRLFRLNADGTMPRDQAGTTPAVAAGIAEARGLAWDPRSGTLWIADEDDGAGHVSGIRMSSPPVRAAVTGRATLHAKIGQLAVYAGDAIPPLRNEGLLASPDGFIMRLQFTGGDSPRIARSGRLLENLVGPVHVVTTGTDGAVYFCTDTALGKLTAVR
jgi:glucose/arabinose dehydrogenase